MELALAVILVQSFLINLGLCSVSTGSPLLTIGPDGVRTDYRLVSQPGTDATVTCTVSGGLPTVWQLGDGTMEYLTFTNNKADNYSYITVADSSNSALTITNFTKELDRFRIICKDGQSNTSDFILVIFGFQAAPMLLGPQVHDVVEDSTIQISVLSNTSDPFPPTFQSFWYCGDIFLQPNQPTECPSCGTVTALPDHVLKIESADRACIGKQFQYSVFNPPQMTSFTLNVLYPPSADLTNSSAVFVSVGDNVTLSVASDIGGNPTPTVSWAFDNPNSPAIEITGKYQSESNGELTISSVDVEDIGDYYVTVSNSIGEDVVSMISLLEYEPRMKAATIDSEGNGLSVNYELAYTGYDTDLDNVSMSITCVHGEKIPVEDHLRYYCAHSCFDNDTEAGAGFIEGPVLAGVSYVCSARVWSNRGSNSLAIDLFRTTIGIPSKPNIFNVSVDEYNVISLQLHTQYSGDNDSFEYVATLSYQDNVMVHNTSLPRSERSDNVYKLPPVVAAGTYSLTVYGRNKYGQFPEGTSASITIRSSHSTTEPPRATPTSTPRPSSDPTDSAGTLQPVLVLLVVLAALAVQTTHHFHS